VRFADMIADMGARPDAYTVWFRQYIDAHGDMLGRWLKGH